MADFVLHLLCRDSAADAAADHLLSIAGPLGFIRAPVYSQGAFHASLTKEEEVIGMCHMVRFDMVVRERTPEELLQGLSSALKGLEVQYWLTPAIAAGSLA
ncbi:DUF3240 domain-containing protein [Xylophilus rhododendri]|uniref:DUF3240 domain-containing protein n=1 Tax=Xylophilus rhododendri TaxID=2697032 RepID=A0A857JCM6_9BURK|nr:DUF3240 family protein [Xylophilus rhododendri]QHJ00436.1 DUF3240 domain-containing protein [Xylophilus rhododendri]